MSREGREGGEGVCLAVFPFNRSSYFFFQPTRKPGINHQIGELLWWNEVNAIWNIRCVQQIF